MPRFALMGGIFVETVIIADNKDSCERALNCELLELADHSPVSFGWRFVDGQWIAPEESPVE